MQKLHEMIDEMIDKMIAKDQDSNRRLKKGKVKYSKQ